MRIERRHPRPTGAALVTLSPRRRQVAELIADGLLNAEIAATIGRTVDTVERHVRDIRDAWQLDRSCNLRVQIAVIVTRERTAA